MYEMTINGEGRQISGKVFGTWRDREKMSYTIMDRHKVDPRNRYKYRIADMHLVVPDSWIEIEDKGAEVN